MKKQLIFFSFIFLLVISSFVLAEETVQNTQEEITIIKTQQNMQQAIDENTRTVTYTFSSADSAIQIQNKDYWSVVPASENNRAYVKTDDKGNLIEADLTASKETSWTFGKESINVPEGARAVYKEGKIEIFGKENQEISLSDKSSGTELKSNLKLGKEAVSISNGLISGKNFEVDGIKVLDGRLSLKSGGYLLSKNSLAGWKGLLLANNEDLFLATSLDETNNYANWILPEISRLRARGDGFEIKFKAGNVYAKIDPKDNFAIKAEKGFEFSLENRNPDGKPELKIPLMNAKGNFVINENSKSLYTKDGKVLIKRDGVLFGESDKSSSTSPIELFVDGQKEKYIVSNFKGIATLSNLDAAEGKTDERYANSIYWKKASNENRYNYPTIGDFESLSGKKLSIESAPVDSPLYAPEVMRELIDFYGTLPKSSKESLQIINIYFENEFNAKFGGSSEAIYNENDNSLNFKLDPNFVGINPGISEETNSFFGSSGLGTFRHEFTHNQQDLLEGLLNARKNNPAYQEKQPLSAEYIKLRQTYGYGSSVPKDIQVRMSYLASAMQELNKNIPQLGATSSFVKEWNGLYVNSIVPDYGRAMDYGRDVQEGNFNNMFTAGFITPYSANNMPDHVAVTVEKVVSDPTFFKRYGLLNSQNYPKFNQELELLKTSGFITPQEYDAVFNPEKYFSAEELANLMKK